MRTTPPHLKALEEIEREGIHGLVEVLREEGLDAVRYALWDATGWHRDDSPPSLAQPGHRGIKEDRLVGGSEDREDPLYCPARGARAAGRGDDGHTLAEGPEGFFRTPR